MGRYRESSDLKIRQAMQQTGSTPPRGREALYGYVLERVGSVSVIGGTYEQSPSPRPVPLNPGGY